MPNIIIPLESNIPLNVNGKIDRTRLQQFYLSSVKSSSKANLINLWQNVLNNVPDMNSNFISNGGNSMLALSFVEYIKQRYLSLDVHYLFDLVLHKEFGDLISYVNNPHQQTQKHEPIEYSLSDLSTRSTTIQSNLNGIWSIHRCSKIFLHRNDYFMREYFSLPEELTCSPKNLTLNWKSSMNKCIDASPLIVLLDDNRQYVIIGSHAGLINAYQIDNGHLIWSFQASNRIEASGSISRNGQFFIIGDYSGNLYIIECSNGNLYSLYQCEGMIKTIPCIHSHTDTIYLGSHDQFIHAILIEKATCKCIWKFALKSSCVSSPQLSKDNTRLYVASLAGDVFALQADNGKLLWKQSLDKPVFSTIAVWNESFLLIGCVDQNLYCLDSNNGHQKWKFLTTGPIFSSPCLFNNTLFIGCHDRYLYAIDLASDQICTLKWKCLFPSMVYASPFIYNNGQEVVVGSTDGCLRILNTQSGDIICKTQVDGNGLFSSPVCYHNLIIVGSRDDYLYCYKMLS